MKKWSNQIWYTIETTQTSTLNSVRDAAEQRRDELMKQMTNNKKYPMTYEEFEKRVIELFLDSGEYATPDEKLNFINEELLVNDSAFIKNLYEEAYYNCVRYGEHVFTDDGLMNQPVRILEMLY